MAALRRFSDRSARGSTRMDIRYSLPRLGPGNHLLRGREHDFLVDGCEIVLENMQWRIDVVDFDMQVAGWTRSASEPTSGAGVDVYVHYLGGGESEIIVNQRKLRMRKAGTEILVGNTFTPLKSDPRVRVRSKEAE